MKSSLPKVLHPVAGRAMVQRVVDTALALQARRIIAITGHQAEQVEAALYGANPQAPLDFARQMPQLGTGHAVQQAVPHLHDDSVVLVLSGDVPLIRPETLTQLVQACAGDRLALLTMTLQDPTGYGRIVREGDQVRAIVEQKDASPEQRALREVYSGILAAPARLLKAWLGRITAQNAQGEYYLTDVVALAVQDGVAVVAQSTDDPFEVAGVNSLSQLAALERVAQRRTAEDLMAQGVRLADPARLDVRGVLECGPDVVIDIGCVFEGHVVLGEGVQIGAHCVLSSCTLEAGTVVQPFTHIDGEAAGVRVGAGSRIGPFARLRPGAVLGREVHIGNFVEVKNSQLADGAKANHLAYLGDATVGERVNYGAGSITANYDGANKHRTVIEADVHVGSNCVLVAPITLGAGGTIGGGSTLTKSTPPGALTVARGKAVSIPNWQRPTKKK